MREFDGGRCWVLRSLGGLALNDGRDILFQFMTAESGGLDKLGEKLDEELPFLMVSCC